ncbi:THAP domain-containing protein 3-like [Ornithodoros turicata]|uniref:THAP domain-containing protein 3-like n=1 Tax=Ornithodoros turicata TaxID=34597 RepID=UPI00313874C1
MPSSCVACKSRYRNGSTVTFHKFPANDTEQFRRWLDFVGRGTWRPSGFSKICSLHFEEKCFKYNNDRRYLVPGSVPTITDLPQHLQKKKKGTNSKKTRATSHHETEPPAPPVALPDVPIEFDEVEDVEFFYEDDCTDEEEEDDLDAYNETLLQNALLSIPSSSSSVEKQAPKAGSVPTTSTPIVMRLSVAPQAPTGQQNAGNVPQAPGSTQAPPLNSEDSSHAVMMTAEQLKQALTAERAKSVKFRQKLKNAKEILQNQQKRILCLEEVINNLRYRLIHSSTRHAFSKDDVESD